MIDSMRPKDATADDELPGVIKLGKYADNFEKYYK